MTALQWKILLAAFTQMVVVASSATAMEIRFGGSVETFGAAYSKHRDGTEDLYGEIHVKPKLTLIPNESFLVHLSADVRQDTAGYTHGLVNDIPDRDDKRAMMELREGYLEYAPPGVRLRIGNQLFDWSVTDTVSPTDNLSSRDWTDVLHWERRPIPAVDLRLGTDSYLEAAISPFFVPSRLALSGARWERDLLPGFGYSTSEYPDSPDPQVALRGGTTWNSIDLGASIFHGYSYSPFWRPEATSSAIVLHPIYLQDTVSSVSAAMEIAGFNARLEAGLFEQEGADDFMQFVVGMDREFGNLVRPSDSLYVLVQYTDESVLHQESPHGVTAFDMRRIFTRCLMGKMHYSMDGSREWNLKLEGAYNLDQHDIYIQPAIVWRKDSLEVETGVDLLAGGADTFFGGYDMNNRLYVKGAYMF